MTSRHSQSFNRLTARGVATETKAGRHGDGGGLYLQVSDRGAKSWLFRFKMAGTSKERQMGLGSVRTVSLAEARAEALDARKLVLSGIDPIKARNDKRNKLRLESAKTQTFRQCSVAYITSHQSGWKNSKHIKQWTSTLEKYAYPIFGDLSVSSIDTGLVMKVIEPIWVTRTETASRVRGRIESILDWAAVHGYRKGENPARWKGHLDNLLPRKSKVAKVRHFPALPYTEIGKFMTALRKREGVAALALEFLVLTAARTNEVIGARASEVAGSVWTIPADRMKAGAEHRVPLSEVALDVIARAQLVSSSDFLFPGLSEGRPLSNTAFLALLKRMGRKDITAHGFRSTFRDWAAEQTSYPREVSEMALAHTVSDKVEAAYRRGDLFEKRRRLMDTWATYCGTASAEGGRVLTMAGTELLGDAQL